MKAWCVAFSVVFAHLMLSDRLFNCFVSAGHTVIFSFSIKLWNHLLKHFFVNYLFWKIWWTSKQGKNTTVPIYTVGKVDKLEVSWMFWHKCNCILDILEDNKIGAAVKPPNLKKFLKFKTDAAWPGQDKVPWQQERDFGKANQVTRGNNSLASVLWPKPLYSEAYF